MFIDGSAISAAAGISVFRERESRSRSEERESESSIHEAPKERTRVREEQTGHLVNVQV